MRICKQSKGTGGVFTNRYRKQRCVTESRGAARRGAARRGKSMSRPAGCRAGYSMSQPGNGPGEVDGTAGRPESGSSPFSAGTTLPKVPHR
jgi:hypothetical protein